MGENVKVGWEALPSDEKFSDLRNRITKLEQQTGQKNQSNPVDVAVCRDIILFAIYTAGILGLCYSVSRP